ncbi:MAG: shikimate kinase [Elusimicrobia bacterium]|nr:shikimate kinase [Elusimicrobiota bacterium]
MKNIVLTGFMGTGKTTVGQLLAEELHRQFFDTDQIIEEKLGASIKEIFKKIGEPKFREFETETIALISNLEDSVISCGGGVVVNPVNVTNLRRNGIIVNLYASPEHIFKRLYEYDTRPLIKQMLNPFDGIKKLLAQRQKAYQQCDFAINTDNISPEDVVKQILSNKKIKDILK